MATKTGAAVLARQPPDQPQFTSPVRIKVPGTVRRKVPGTFSLLSGQRLGGDAQERGDLAQLGLNQADVAGAHAQELPLGGRQRLQPGVRELVRDALRRQRDVTVDDRCLQQLDDGPLECLVEIAVRVAQLAVAVDQARPERRIEPRGAAGIEGGDGVRVLVVAAERTRRRSRDCRAPRAPGNRLPAGPSRDGRMGVRPFAMLSTTTVKLRMR